MKKIAMKKIMFFCSMMLALSLCGSMSQAKAKTPEKTEAPLDSMEVHFIDVGQGDATLIKCGDSAMLIDAGDNSKGTLVQNYLRKQKVESLDYLIVTHPDADHCGGADVIVTKYDIDTVIMSNYEKDTATYRDLMDSMDYKKYKATNPVVGDTYKLGDAEFTIIAPNKEDYGEVTNNYSVGILLEHGEKKFLFTGDAEEEAEADILKNKIDLSADVLKAGHHGSKTSSSEELVQTVAPEFAVISCAEDNEYGMPNASVLNILRSENIKVYRTDEQGSLIAASDGKTIKWNAAPSTTWQAGEPTKSSTGSVSKSDKAAASKKEEKKIESTPTPDEKSQETAPAVEAPKQEEPAADAGPGYVLNVKTKKFHLPSCGSLPTTNRSDSTQSRDEIIGQGYDPCKKCNP